MLTIGRLGRGQETYYLEKVAHGVEDYYTLSGEPAGHWLGAGSGELGLSGVVEDAALHDVLLGYHPATRWALVPGAGDTERRPGFDLTFSAPKGVTLLALLGPEEVRGPAIVAHRDAVAQAFGYLERHAAWVRRGAGGAEHLHASGFVAAAFLHRSSRAEEPQLHTHLLVANLGRAADGRWSALYGRVLYREARTAGFLYQAALRRNLTRDLGLEWHPVVRGLAEPVGIPASVLRGFSSRRAAIEEALEERGASTARSAQVAAYRTRAAKTDADAVDLPAQWRARAAELGFDVADLGRLIGPGQQAELVLGGHVSSLVGSEGLTAHASSFDRRAVVRELAERAADGASVAEVERAADSFLGRPELIELAPLPDMPEGRRWSTRELVALEESLVERALRPSPLPAAPRDAVDRALADRPSLDDEQRRLVRALLSPKTAASVVIGPAGTGKTYALDAARAVWQASGHHVVGVALAGRAAVELSGGAGIPATTLARFLSETEAAGGELPARSVIVLDESGMVGTRQLVRLFAVAERDRAQLVLVGDHRQLPEIEAGGVLSGLASRSEVLSLSANRRQQEAWERAALAELRAGDVGLAIEAYRSEGRITYSDTAAGARAAMVARWLEARTAGASAVMLAVHRSDVDELNARARVALRAAGLLGSEDLSLGGRRYAVGDEVMPLRNDKNLGLVNGVRAHVTDVDRSGFAVEIEAGDRRIVVPPEYIEAGYLGHGYACTVHKFQGGTVDRAFLLGGDALYREAGYVGLSRARQRTDLFVVAAPADLELMHGRSKWEQTDPVAELLGALRQSRAQEMALEGLGRGIGQELPWREAGREQGIER